MVVSRIQIGNKRANRYITNRTQIGNYIIEISDNIKGIYYQRPAKYTVHVGILNTIAGYAKGDESLTKVFTSREDADKYVEELSETYELMEL